MPVKQENDLCSQYGDCRTPIHHFRDNIKAYAFPQLGRYLRHGVYPTGQKTSKQVYGDERLLQQGKLQAKVLNAGDIELF